MAMTGMTAGVAAVSCDVVCTMGKTVIQQHRVLPVAVMVLSFIAAYFFDVNIILIIVICGVVGALDTIRQSHRRKETGLA